MKSLARQQPGAGGPLSQTPTVAPAAPDPLRLPPIEDGFDSPGASSVNRGTREK
jgi:hypothetical protein